MSSEIPHLSQLKIRSGWSMMSNSVIRSPSSLKCLSMTIWWAIMEEPRSNVSATHNVRDSLWHFLNLLHQVSVSPLVLSKGILLCFSGNIPSKNLNLSYWQWVSNQCHVHDIKNKGIFFLCGKFSRPIFMDPHLPLIQSLNVCLGMPNNCWAFPMISPFL